MNIKVITSLCKSCKSVNKYRPVHFNAVNPIAVKNEKLINPAQTFISKSFNKTEILTKYSMKNDLNPEDVMNEFKEVEKYLDETSVERLLKLTSEGKIKLCEKPKVTLVKKKFFFSEDYFAKSIADVETKPILNYTREFEDKFGKIVSKEEAAKLLNILLVFEKEGKIPPSEIAEILKLRKFGISSEQCKELIDAIHNRNVDSKNIMQARLFLENDFSLKLLNAKSIDELSNNQLKELVNILASKSTNRKAADGERLQRFKDKICELDTPILPHDLRKRTELLSKVSKKLTSLTKINKVDANISRKFISDIKGITEIFEKSKHTINDLYKAGGIKLSYPRESFKQNILKQIEHLSKNEQNTILAKFGLQKESEQILSGLPVYIENTANMSKEELAINSEICKFLKDNKIILPSGFEEFQKPLEEICETFPEFKFAIGSIQHTTHSKDLAGHILMAFQENVKNPLYTTLTPTDKKILGISTLLHDISKIEQTVDKTHPIMSSKVVNAIVERIPNLSIAEKNRIINFVENHHWLEKIKNSEEFTQEEIDNLAYIFRKGNDFTMAKIFAESDLKAVNTTFYPRFGSKINSKMTKAIENRIATLQADGRLVYTTDITLDNAIRMGAKKVKLGNGENATENWVISAKDLGLDTENILYHAPGKSDAFILAESGFGYGNEGVLSCSLGRAGHSGTFQNRKEFIVFKKTDMDNISLISTKNANSGADKTYINAKKWILNGTGYGRSVRNKYLEMTKKNLSESDYASIYRIASQEDKITKIHSNPQIQAILGGEKEAMAFENSVKEVNELFVSSPKTYNKGFVPEVVCHDMEFAAIGTNRNANEIDYALRNRYPLIVEF